MRIPIFPELREVIDASETGDLHYLVTDGPYAGKQRGYKQPFTADGFGNFFWDAVRAAGPRRDIPAWFAKGLRSATG